MNKPQLETTLKSRRLVNPFHLKDNIEDVLYSSPLFTIEQEEGELIRYKKTKIIFNTYNSNESSSWVSPEIDSINLIDFSSSDKYLFNSLRELGYDSYLINLFAKNELDKAPFKDPLYNNILLKRTTSKTSDDSIQYHYHLNGGSLYFQRILECDPKFWLELVRACKETNLIKISELHIAADSNKDLMKQISHSIRNGHYECNGLNPKAYYVYNGKKYFASVGKYSSQYKSFKDRILEVETLYIGDKRRQPVTVVFYDKEKEEMERSNSISNNKTRIEIRFNTNVSSEIPLHCLESLIKSYYVENGAGFRTKVFLYFLNQTIRFTDHFRSTNYTEMSNWWRHGVLIPLYQASLNMFPENINSYLNGTKDFLIPSNDNFILENKIKRKRGRPLGKKDSKPRKKRKSANNEIDI